MEASERVLLPVKGQWRHGPTLRVKGLAGRGLVDSSHRADALGGPGRGQARPAHPRHLHLRLEANGLARSPAEKTGSPVRPERPTRMQNIIKWLHDTRSRSASAVRVRARCLKQGDALPAGESEEAAGNRSNLTRVPGKVWACGSVHRGVLSRIAGPGTSGRGAWPMLPCGTERGELTPREMRAGAFEDQTRRGLGDQSRRVEGLLQTREGSQQL